MAAAVTALQYSRSQRQGSQAAVDDALRNISHTHRREHHHRRGSAELSSSDSLSPKSVQKAHLSRSKSALAAQRFQHAASKILASVRSTNFASTEEANEEKEQEEEPAADPSRSTSSKKHPLDGSESSAARTDRTERSLTKEKSKTSRSLRTASADSKKEDSVKEMPHATTPGSNQLHPNIFSSTSSRTLNGHLFKSIESNHSAGASLARPQSNRSVGKASAGNESGGDRSSGLDSERAAMDIRQLLEEHNTELGHVKSLFPMGLSATMPSRSEVRPQGFRGVVTSILGAPSWDLIMGLVIVLNLAVISWEQTYRLDDRDGGNFDVLEHIFLTIYVVEVVGRFYVWGWDCMRSTFVAFDVFIVVVGVCTTWIIKPIFGDVEELGPLFILRIARLLRLVRALRVMIIFRELWMLVRGLMSALRTMLYTVLLLCVMLYAFASVALELLARHHLVVGEDPDAVFKEVVETNFSDLPTAMLTLMQFVTFDNIVYIYTPLVKRDWKLLGFFVCVIMVVGIVLMNLVTAVIVNSALEQAVQDKDLTRSMEEDRRKKLVKEMRKIFLHLDEDGSGLLSRTEIQAISSSDREILHKLMGMNDPVEIFDALDVNGDEEIGIEEFVDGIWHVVVSNTPIHVKRMEKQLDLLRAQMNNAQELQLEFQNKIDSKLDKVMCSVGKTLSQADPQRRVTVTSNNSASVALSAATSSQQGQAQAGEAGASAEARLGKERSRSGKSWTALAEGGNSDLSGDESSPMNGADAMPAWACELVAELHEACRAAREVCWKDRMKAVGGTRQYKSSYGSIRDVDELNVRRATMPSRSGLAKRNRSGDGDLGNKRNPSSEGVQGGSMQSGEISNKDKSMTNSSKSGEIGRRSVDGSLASGGPSPESSASSAESELLARMAARGRTSKSNGSGERRAGAAGASVGASDADSEQLPMRHYDKNSSPAAYAGAAARNCTASPQSSGSAALTPDFGLTRASSEGSGGGLAAANGENPSPHSTSRPSRGGARSGRLLHGISEVPVPSPLALDEQDSSNIGGASTSAKKGQKVNCCRPPGGDGFSSSGSVSAEESTRGERIGSRSRQHQDELERIRVNL